jgi:hypothetical protein
MPGIEQDPFSDIQNIRELLKDYAPGFAFLKELLQNADDGEASVLRLVWSPGLKDASHPLLRAPALLALNDGKFTKSDRDSLMRMGLGNKGANSGKIGKFGLGTKSIFHVAEAFFFLESTGKPDLRDILNPWSPRHHKDWDTVEEEDWELLSTAIGQQGVGLEQWFAIWIPLRRESDLDGVKPIQTGTDANPGEESCCPQSLKDPIQQRGPRLCELLLLLQNLKVVEFHAGGGESNHFRIDRKGGIIEQDDTRLNYSVITYDDPERVEPWTKRPSWPQVFETQDDGGQESRPDKAKWSHSITLTTTQSEKKDGCLRIYWSVFLPVGNKPYIEVPLVGGGRDISLFLHGYFFLSSSRTQIDGLEDGFPSNNPDDPTGVCRSWNHELACDSEGVLPALLPALTRWSEDGSLLADEIPLLTKAIYDSQRWDPLKKYLSEKGSLLYCCEQGMWAWRWVSTETVAMLIPCIKTLDKLALLEDLTRSTADDVCDQRIVLAVDFAERRALRTQLKPLDAEGLVQLRVLVGKSALSLSDKDAELLEGILGSVAPDGVPAEWDDVPLFRVKYGGTGSWSLTTLTELRALEADENLFCGNGHNLAPALAKATGRDDGPAIADSRSARYLDLHNLNFERAATWLLKQDTLSPDSSKRLPLVKRFSGHEIIGHHELQAIRYLAHADPEFRDDESKVLYFASTPLVGFWLNAYQAVLKSCSESWRLIDHAFTQTLNESLKQRASIQPCSRENWPSLIESLGDQALEIDFSSVDEEVLEWVLKETPEDQLKCLDSLKIHRLASGEMVAASDCGVWLQGELNVPETLEESWNQLRENARIIKRSVSVHVHLRQKALFDDRILDVSGALKLAADSDSPKLFSALILHLLGDGTPRAEATKSLKQAQWLPLGEANNPEAWASPDQVLHLKDAETVLDRVLSGLPTSDFLSSKQLGQDLHDSNGWATLTSQILRPAKGVFEILSRLFAQQPCPYTLGFCAEINNEHLERWLSVAKDCDHDELFPARPLLAAVYDNESWRDNAMALAQVLARPFEDNESDTRYSRMLEFLKRLFSGEGNERKPIVLGVIADYLRGASECGAWDRLKQDPDLELLSQSRVWKSIRKLAPPCSGVQESSLLHPELAAALGLTANTVPQEHLPQAVDAAGTVSETESVKNLRRGLGPFCAKLPHKAVAILPALLGNERPMMEFVEDLLDGISVASIRDELIPLDVQERAEGWSFRVELIEGSTVSLESIAGPAFQASLKPQADSIFLPNPNGHLIRSQGERLQVVCVADPSRFSEESERRLQEVLLESIRNLLWWAYVRKSPNLESIFEKFANLGQMSLGVARQEILMSADTQLQLLGVRPVALEEARGIATEGRSRLAEAEAGIGDAKRLLNLGKEKDQEARELFREVLDGNSGTHGELVSAVRRRIQQQQYELDSIPFEIFQNADDAATELIQSVDLDDNATSLATKFVICADNNGVRFFYGGRPVNDACGQTGPSGARWRRDLVKMLLINGSDKNIDEGEQVTGKFGLGFKSVFLLSPRPLVMSGALAFEIVGGIWPRPLPDADALALDAEADDAFGVWSRRTCISLKGESDDQAKALARFFQLAPWVPVFARSLKTIVTELDGVRSSFTWSPKEARHSSCLRIGTISLEKEDYQYLELTDGRTQWLFRLDRGGLKPMPDYVPWLWVTAPTREPGHGFALNGPFSLDPGRTRLSKQDDDVTGTNRLLFQRAAALLFEEFGKLAVDFPANATDLALEDERTFWRSVWGLFTKMPSASDSAAIEGTQHLSEALWCNSPLGGYSKLITKHRVIPQDLPSPMDGLTSLPKLGWAVSGWLSENSGIHCLSTLLKHTLLEEEAPDAFCSASIASQLRSRCSAEIKSLDLAGLLKNLAGEEKRLDPAPCEIIAVNLFSSSDGTPSKLSDGLKPQEVEDLKSLSKTLKFKSVANTWELVEHLILGSGHNADEDEALRYAFAPPSRLLSKDYSADCAKLFLALRARLNADVTQLADWIREPSSDARLKAGLKYIAVGKLRQELALELGPIWLQDIRGHQVFKQLDDTTRRSIGYVFGAASFENEQRVLYGEQGWDTPVPEVEIDEPDLPLIDSEDICNAWDLSLALERFTISGSLGALILPNANDENEIVHCLGKPETLDGKAAWYRLLCLGCTLGLPLGTRAVDQVKKLWNEDLGPDFWRVTILDPLDPTTTEAFNENLDSFFEEKIHQLFKNEDAAGEKAPFWRRVFYDFRKMHHFVFRNDLPETILDFARHEEADGHALINFLKTGRVPDFMLDTSTGHYRGVIGQSMTAPLLFVMRELCRLEIIDGRFAPACYYMNGPARKVAHRLNWLGEDSKLHQDFGTLVGYSEQIHECMLKELPDLAEHFDLPLQIYAYRHPR